ncbi:MAG: protein phosphatase CheZ [Rickettsiales bacterium]
MASTTITEAQLKKEIEKIGEYISQAKAEIAAISLHQEESGSDKNIAHATLELNEVVRHTEEATNSIMDKAEAIMALAGNVSDADTSAKLGEYAVNILEACSFQDITGQRIKKVLKTLQQIELRVGNLIKLFGGNMPAGLQIGEIETTPRRADEDLLNGPQMGGDGVSQADIDKLFGNS